MDLPDVEAEPLPSLAFTLKVRLSCSQPMRRGNSENRTTNDKWCSMTLRITVPPDVADFASLEACKISLWPQLNTIKCDMLQSSE